MKKSTAITVMGGIAALIAGLDIYWLQDGVEGNTISSVVQENGWAAGLAGYIAVHVARKPDGVKRSWGLTALGAGVAAGLGHVLDGGIISLVLGGVAGWFGWPNSGKT